MAPYHYDDIGDAWLPATTRLATCALAMCALATLQRVNHPPQTVAVSTGVWRVVAAIQIGP
jgi:hypothetical protein